MKSKKAWDLISCFKFLKIIYDPDHPYLQNGLFRSVLTSKFKIAIG